MKKFYRDYLSNNLYFWIFGGISVLLITISFFIPPLAFVEGSVLAATGELFAFAALGAVIHAIDMGKTATIQHGSTSLTVKDVDEEETE